MPDGNASRIEPCRLRFRGQPVLVVVHRHTVGNILKHILHLDALDCVGVTERYVKKQWEDLLLEEIRIETKRDEDRRYEAASANGFFNLIGKYSCCRLVRHSAAPVLPLRLCEVSRGSTS